MPVEIIININERNGRVETEINCHSIATQKEALLGQAMARACQFTAEWIGEKMGERDVIVKDINTITPLEKN